MGDTDGVPRGVTDSDGVRVGRLVVGERDRLSVNERLADSDVEGDTLADTVAEAVSEADAVGLGEAVGVAQTDGVGEGDADTVGVRDLDGD